MSPSDLLEGLMDQIHLIETRGSMTIEELQNLDHNKFLKIAEHYASQAGKDFDWLSYQIILSECCRRLERLGPAIGADIKTFEIWAEGYKASGDSGTAHKLGSASGTTFEQACTYFFNHAPNCNKSYYNQKDNTYWACRLFDNETDARKAFG